MKDKEAISCVVSHALALNSYSQRKDPAVEFIKFAVGPDVQKVQFDQFTNFPSLTSTAKQVSSRRPGARAEWLGQLEGTIATGREWPKLPGFSRVSTLMYSTIESALSQQASPTDALNAAAADADEILSAPGPTTNGVYRYANYKGRRRRRRFPPPRKPAWKKRAPG